MIVTIHQPNFFAYYPFFQKKYNIHFFVIYIHSTKNKKDIDNENRLENIKELLRKIA